MGIVRNWELTECNNHEDGGHTKGQGETRLLSEAVHLLAQVRRHVGGNERTGVDCEIENGEELLELFLLLRTLELVASECRDARFDASCTDGDCDETNQRTRTGCCWWMYDKKRDKIITGLKRNEFKCHLIVSLIIIYYYTWGSRLGMAETLSNTLPNA